MVATSLTPKSALRHRPVGPVTTTSQAPRVPRASRTQHIVKPAERSAKQVRRSPHTLVWLGLGMLFVLGAQIFGQLVVSWVGTLEDDLYYGRPRTYQTDAYVGHETGTTPSHFIALNLHGQIEVIELPGGDPSRTRIYEGPQLYGPGADLVPVTLQFPDPNHTHHPDMLILFKDTQIVFHNVQGTFRPG